MRSVTLSAPAPDVIHVWRAAVSAAPLEALSGVLDRDERARAERFLFERDRNQFVVARGLLRWLLSGYLRCEPAAVQFAYGSAGKPVIAGDCGMELRFNVSHSHDTVLLAFAVGQDIGVDVEYIRDMNDLMDLARVNFSDREQRMLLACEPREQVSCFFQLWTAKEAYIKMAGGGLSIPLQDFTVAVDSMDAQMGVSVSIQRATVDLPPAHVQAIRIGAGYVAAVAAGETSWRVDLFEAEGPVSPLFV